MKKNHQHLQNKCIYQATVEVHLPSSTLKKMIMCIWSYSMEHFRKHLQCLMAGSKIQVKIYIHFNIKFTFTSFKEYNPKNKSMTNKQTKTNKQKNHKRLFLWLLVSFFYLYLWNTIFSEYLPAFYAICPTSNCSDDLHIVTNNGVYDEISNTVSFKDDFYLPCETRDDHLQSSVPIWLNSTQVNVSDVGQFNAFGLVKFAQHGTY